MNHHPSDAVTEGLAVYLVGGAVRDALLGIAVVDRDHVVVGTTPDAMLKRGFKPVGADFPVFIHPRSGEEYALARTERKSGRGYRGFAFHADPSVTIEDDLRRRDFTINAMAQAADGELVDPYGGAADLTARRLAHVSEAFAEDPVRVLRSARFMARFADLGFKIAPATLALMRAMVASGEVDALVPERVWQELRRALAMPKPAEFLRTMRTTGALARVLPEVDALYGVPQPAQWHPEIDCGVHTELVLDMAAQLAPGNDRVGFAALVHDLGKALTPADILPGHRGHETAGLAPINALSERVGVPGEHRRLARIVCREHLNIHRLAELRPSTVVALLERVGAFQRADVIDELASACEADKRGRTGLADVPYPQAGWLKSLHAAGARVRVADLDLDPSLAGPAIGEALRRARIAAVAQARAVLAIDV